MTQNERIHHLQRLWGTITTRVAGDSDLRAKIEFRMLDELIKGLHGRPRSRSSSTTSSDCGGRP